MLYACNGYFIKDGQRNFFIQFLDWKETYVQICSSHVKLHENTSRDMSKTNINVFYFAYLCDHLQKNQ